MEKATADDYSKYGMIPLFFVSSLPTCLLSLPFEATYLPHVPTWYVKLPFLPMKVFFQKSSPVIGDPQFSGAVLRWIDATWGPVDGVRSTHWPIGLRDSGGSSLCGGHQWQHEWRLAVERTSWKPFIKLMYRSVFQNSGVLSIPVEKTWWHGDPWPLSPFNKKIIPNPISQYHTFVEPQVVGCNAVSLPWKLCLPVGQSWGATLCNRGCWNAWKRWVEMVKWETQPDGSSEKQQ